MKNPFARRSIKTSQPRDRFFDRLEAGVAESDYSTSFSLRGDVARVTLRERGRQSFLTFSGVLLVRYFARERDSIISFRLRPSLIDAALFLTVIILLLPGAEIPDAKWRVAEDFHPSIFLIPILALIGMKMWGVFEARSAMKQIVFHAAS